MTKKRKPTRRDLLVVIGRLQNAIGTMRATIENDRNPDLMDDFLEIASPAFDLCVEARSHDAPISVTSGPWGAKEKP